MPAPNEGRTLGDDSAVSSTAEPAELWQRLREERVPLDGLERERVPARPGILVFYREANLTFGD